MESLYFTPEKRPIYLQTLVDILNGLTPSQVTAGKEWYRQAFDRSEEVAGRHKVPGIVVRRIVARISPRNRWERSWNDVENILLYGNDAKVCTPNNNKFPAVQMAQDHTLHLFKPTTLKTWHFFTNIHRYTKNTGVTVDRHAVTLFGIPFTPNKKGPNSRLSNRQYLFLSDIYQEVADMFGYLWHEAQAMAWLFERQRKGVWI